MKWVITGAVVIALLVAWVVLSIALNRRRPLRVHLARSGCMSTAFRRPTRR